MKGLLENAECLNVSAKCVTS